jgi:hypothetical protein
LIAFFERPQDFLLDTITNLSDECRAAIAVVFLNGGKVRSPVPSSAIHSAANAFGVSEGSIRTELEALNGSILLLAQDEIGPYWTYKHPTVSDAFSRYVAGSPEKIEIYLRGATPSSLLYEVVCAGVTIGGAPVVIPNSLHPLLIERIVDMNTSSLRIFLSYRSNKEFSKLVLAKRPDLLEITHFVSPIDEDVDTSLVVMLHSQVLLPEELRRRFVDSVRNAAIEEADSSVFDSPSLEALLTEDEKAEIYGAAKQEVLDRISEHVSRLVDGWEPDYPPDDYFTQFKSGVERFIDRILEPEERIAARRTLSSKIRLAVSRLNDGYEPPSATSAPTAQSKPANIGLLSLFRDVDE